MFFTPNLVIGFTIMSVGAVLLLDTLGIRDAASMLKFWPALIVLFGGSLVAHSEGLGKGATFTLELPLNQVGRSINPACDPAN